MVRSVDIRGLEADLANLANVNRQVAMAQYQADQEAEARKRQQIQTLASLAGAGIGYGAGGTASSALYGLSAGQLAGSVITGQPVNPAQVARLGLQGVELDERSAAQDTNETLNKATVEAALSKLTAAPGTADVSQEFGPATAGEQGRNSAIDQLRDLSEEDLRRANPQQLQNLLGMVMPEGSKPSEFTLGPNQARFRGREKIAEGPTTTNGSRTPLPSQPDERKIFIPKGQSIPGTEEVVDKDTYGTMTFFRDPRSGEFTLPGAFVPEKPPKDGSGSGSGGGGRAREFESVILPDVYRKALNTTRTRLGKTEILDVAATRGFSIEDLKRVGEVNPLEVEKQYVKDLEAMTRSNIPKDQKDVARAEIARVKSEQKVRDRRVKLAKTELGKAGSQEEIDAIRSQLSDEEIDLLRRKGVTFTYKAK